MDFYYIFYFFFILVTALLLYAVYPLYKIIQYKLKFGKRALVAFSPIAGIYRFFMKSYNLRGDCLEMLYRESVRNNKNLSVILTNFGFKFVIVLLDPQYIKDLTVNKNDYY